MEVILSCEGRTEPDLGMGLSSGPGLGGSAPYPRTAQCVAANLGPPEFIQSPTQAAACPPVSQ